MTHNSTLACSGLHTTNQEKLTMQSCLLMANCVPGRDISCTINAKALIRPRRVIIFSSWSAPASLAPVSSLRRRDCCLNVSGFVWGACSKISSKWGLCLLDGTSRTSNTSCSAPHRIRSHTSRLLMMRRNTLTSTSRTSTLLIQKSAQVGHRRTTSWIGHRTRVSRLPSPSRNSTRARNYLTSSEIFFPRSVPHLLARRLEPSRNPGRVLESSKIILYSYICNLTKQISRWTSPARRRTPTTTISCTYAIPTSTTISFPTRTTMFIPVCDNKNVSTYMVNIGRSTYVSLAITDDNSARYTY